MTNRITVTDLRNAVEIHNEFMASSGSNYYFTASGRNGYQAVDLHYFDATGRQRCLRNVGLGTSRECTGYLRQESHNLRGEIFGHHAGGKLGRAMAKAVLARHINFSADFHMLPSWKVSALVTWAKLTKYRKPKNASGSTARYFFYHLANRVTVEG